MPGYPVACRPDRRMHLMRYLPFARSMVLLGVVLAVAVGCTSAPAAAPSAPAKAPAATSPPATSAAPAASANPTVPSAPSAAPERQSLKYGYNPILPGAPEFIAQER